MLSEADLLLGRDHAVVRHGGQQLDRRSRTGYASRAPPCRRPQPRVAPAASPSTGPGVMGRHLVSAQGLRQGPCYTTRRDTIGGRKGTGGMTTVFAIPCA